MKEEQTNIYKQLENLEERSEQVRDIMGRAPNWMIRWGTTVVFTIIAGLLLGSAVVSYNDILSAPIIITSKNPPVYLKARSSGKMTGIFVTPGQEVKKGMILAEIENAASLEDIKYLREELRKNTLSIFDLEGLNEAFPPYLNLGSLQSSYGNFRTAYQNHILYNLLEPDRREALAIRRQLNEQLSLLAKQEQQIRLLEQDLQLSKRNHERMKGLLEKEVIAQSEYEAASRDYLSDQREYEAFLSNIYKTRIAIANFQNQLTKSDIESKEFKNTYQLELDRAFQGLKSAMTSWEQQFLIISPINGEVTLFDIWDHYQSVERGETLFTLIPENLDQIIGRVSLPLRNSGKVAPGQQVNIKLTNYPFEEWGSLQGTIRSVSEVPKQGDQPLYTVFVEVNSLRTSYNKEISFKQEMQGQAEIVLEELSLMQRIFYQIRKVLTRE